MSRFSRLVFSSNITLSLLLLAAVVFSVVKIVQAAAPDPGHNFTQTSGGVVQGDLLYGSAADTLLALAKDANATRYLSNTGTTNNPAWAQVNLANGITGVLPVANGNNNSSYRTILQASGSHIAARAAGTYGMGMGDPLAVSGTGTLYPLQVINIVGADYPTVGGVAPVLRIRAQLNGNDTDPGTGNFTIGLHPITRPATSGGAGLVIYTIGAAVAGSNGAVFTNPTTDASLTAVGSDFAIPADGQYVLAVVTTTTMATSSHVHISAHLQMRNN